MDVPLVPLLPPTESIITNLKWKFENMTDDENMKNELKSLKSLYEISIDTRNFEINQLIQRNNFFMLFQGVLLASVLQAELSRPFVEFTICIAGLLVSIYQMQMASSAKFWQEWWEERVDHFEKLLCEKLKESSQTEPYVLFSTESSEVKRTVASKIVNKKHKITNALMLANYSVGRAPIKVSIVLIFTWLTLLASTMNWQILSWVPDLITGFPINQIN